jgi:hypothetical protein
MNLYVDLASIYVCIYIIYHQKKNNHPSWFGAWIKKRHIN